MNQDDAAKLLNEIVQHQARIDALNAEIATLKKQNKRLKVRADRQCMAIAELREQCRNTRQLAHGILIGLLLAGIINTILAFV